MLSAKIQKIGNGLYLNIPKKVAGFLQLQAGDRIVIWNMEKDNEKDDEKCSKHVLEKM